MPGNLSKNFCKSPKVGRGVPTAPWFALARALHLAKRARTDFPLCFYSMSNVRCSMFDVSVLWRSATIVSALFLASAGRADDKITYTDHILPLVEANCSKCHNADKKKADLDLTSYQGALKGSGSGVVLVSGNPDGSKLWKAITHAEEPFMPPNRPALAEKEQETFKKWILGGLLENAGGKAIAAAKPSADLALKIDTTLKPEGPPPMPQELPV